MINGINDCESSPATGAQVIKYMQDRKLYPCPGCLPQKIEMAAFCEVHRAALPCEKSNG